MAYCFLKIILWLSIFTELQKILTLENAESQPDIAKTTSTTSVVQSAFKPQVPDDDFHDNGEELSEEDIPLPTEKSTSVKSSRYFYRNNQRFSVNNAEMENIDDYKAFGKDGSRLRRMNLMKQNDFLEIKGVNGPILKNRITWVNMMRANRGWYPKRSAE